MRRYAFLLLLIVALLAAACGGGDDNDDDSDSGSGDPTTAAVDGGGEDPTAPPEPTAIPATPDPDVPATIVPAPPVGELGTVPPPVTEEPTPDPNEPADANVPSTGFEYLFFSQEGGPDDITIQIEVYADGRVVRDGQTIRLSQEEIARLATMIDELAFFDMIATFIGPPRDQNPYEYLIYVERAGQNRSVRAMDGYIPPEVRSLFGLIRGYGDQVVQQAG